MKTESHSRTDGLRHWRPQAIAVVAIIALLAAFLALVNPLWSSPAFGQSDANRPSNLTARVVDGGVLLTWDAPSEDIDSLTGYQILRRRTDLDAVGNFHILVSDTGSTTSSYTDTTATVAGKRYTYRVKAMRGSVASGQSNYAFADIPEEQEPAPTQIPEPMPTATPAPTPDPVDLAPREALNKF